MNAPTAPAGTTGAPPRRPPTERRRGLDLFKGLAAYGVVVIHSLGNLPRSEANENFVFLFLGFAVPYFLAVSLFLTAGKLTTSGPRGFLRGRVERLVVPYVAWSAIFVAFRTVLYLAAGRRDALTKLWGSPGAIVFFGGASAQLYFVPLLLAGELLAVGLAAALGGRLRRASVVVPLALAGLALSGFEGVRHLATGIDRARAPVLWVTLGGLSYAAWCFPYLALALVMQLPSVRRRVEAIPFRAVPFLAVGVLLVDATILVPWLPRYLPPMPRELAVAFGALAVGLAASRGVPPMGWLDNLSACTFGIYLMHPLVIEAFELVLGRLGLTRGVVVQPWLIAPFALAAFLVTWGLVARTIRAPLLARVLYGVRPAREVTPRA